jgi:putative redox protein
MNVDLEWKGGERFEGTADGAAVTLDGSAAVSADLSPMQALAAGLAGCMAIDIASILEKGRQPLSGLAVHLHGDRAAEPPRRFVSYTMEVEVRGAVDLQKVERAIELSRATYCSVWHSLRPDTPFEVTTKVVPG